MYVFYKFISGYGSTKFIKIGEYVPALLQKVYCHDFYAHNVYSKKYFKLYLFLYLLLS